MALDTNCRNIVSYDKTKNNSEMRFVMLERDWDEKIDELFKMIWKNEQPNPLQGRRGTYKFLEDGHGVRYLNERAWIRKVNNLRKVVMDEAYRSRYSIHPGADKMYKDVKGYYWWPGMKKDIALYVKRNLACAKVKAEHQNPFGLLHQPEILVWKWEEITMDFVTSLRRTTRGHDCIWVVVDWLTKSAQSEKTTT
ncbi:putative reverse transcriptase domain-containing protein [Tanacetum coccineum]